MMPISFKYNRKEYYNGSKFTNTGRNKFKDKERRF